MRFKHTLTCTDMYTGRLGGDKQYYTEIIVRKKKKKRDSCVRTVGEVENKATMGMQSVRSDITAYFECFVFSSYLHRCTVSQTEVLKPYHRFCGFKCCSRVDERPKRSKKTNMFFIITVLIWTYCRKALQDYIFSRQTTVISISLIQQCTFRVKAH